MHSKPRTPTLRNKILFNDDWLYSAQDVDDRTDDSAFETVTLPHTNIVLPWHNFDNQEYQFVSTYRKHFTLPEARNGRRVFLDFDGAMIASTVSVNGHRVGVHAGGYIPFSFDVTDLLRDGDNLVTVKLDSTERPDIPPYGFVVDYLTFGGIYRDTWLRFVDPVHIKNTFVRPLDVLTDAQKLEVDVTLSNAASTSARGSVRVTLDLPDGGTTDATTDYQIAAGADATVTLRLDNLPQMALWTLDNPALHTLRVSVDDADEVSVRYGFREAHFSDDGSFYLNGQPLKLRGLNRHQTYPYVGAAVSARLQRKDADIVKYELGCNIVRTSHYPQSPYFIDRCDEIGLLVFEEIPGWQFIGDDDWKALSLADVEAMILRDRNHPSIILWGVRINESQDDHDFYTATNKLAHLLDPTRQTGGVRYIRGSEFLEDVYTYNDFSNTIIEPEQTPHLVTEFGGHMFPTKTWDGEERALEHALRHTHVQDAAKGNPRVAGAIGWCAFDYNTHSEFGSGDRICYHGVMDIFRLPKMAAYLYESQIEPSVRPVLRVATYWTMGDRSVGGNDPIWVFSNCDEIEVIVGGEVFKRVTPNREDYPHLAHPPFKVEGLKQFMTWGRSLWDLRVVGYINGEAVAEALHDGSGLPAALVLEAADSELNADGSDMTWLWFKIVDKYGNRRPYATQAVSFEISGPGELIGENPFALVGGQAGMLVKAGKTPGTITIRASTMRLPDAEISITIR
jgi:beta-galactosidase